MAGPTTRARGFGMRLAFVVLAGAGVRLLYDLVVLHRLRLGIDASWYYLEGGVIRREHAFADPDLFATRPRGHRGLAAALSRLPRVGAVDRR